MLDNLSFDLEQVGVEAALGKFDQRIKVDLFCER
jgi:hypothetical protein